MLKAISSTTNALGALNYKGTWNASTNTPTLTSSVGAKGDYYVVSVAGATNLNGISNWGIGDLATFNGSVWQRVEGGADGNFVNLSVSGTSTLSNLTVSTALALDASKNVVSVTNTGTGSNVLSTTPTLVGDVSLSTGNLVISTSGKGIDFSATAGTGTSELLDDYEEGYFNPTLTCGTSGTITVNTTEDTLAYTKIGRVVYISGQFAISSVSSPVGTVTLNNLPFAVASLDERAESAIFNVVLSNTTLNTPTFFGLITTAGGTTLLIRAKDNAGAINSSPASLFAANDVWIGGCYLTAA